MNTTRRIALLGLTTLTLASRSYLKDLASVADAERLLPAIPDEYELVEVKEEYKTPYQKLMDKAINHEKPNVDNRAGMTFHHLKHTDNLKNMFINDTQHVWASREDGRGWHKDDVPDDSFKYDA